MSKRSRRGLSKKWIPAGAVRITNSEGKRVWKYGDLEFPSMRELIFRVRPVKEENKKEEVEVSAEVESPA